ncbi:MAG TPA: lipopolysaccharide transport periplasmic protein LptA [Gammaproteobacteria bacterium]|nr:lipopolysaccharide transport periplasmic protein LptA [Gammaproteobacteria bacterium]
MPMPHPIKLLPMLSLFGLLIPGNCLALSTDRDQPAHFIADKFQTNQKTGITIFTGHVQMDQGTTHLTADKVTVYNGEHGRINKAIAVGAPAHYSTLPDNEKKNRMMDAYGKTIEYYPQLRKAVILGDGIVIQGPNRLNGEHIIYELDKQLATSLPTGTAQSVLVLQPQDLPGQ